MIQFYKWKIAKKGEGFSLEKIVQLMLVIIVVVILFYFLGSIKDVGDIFLTIFN